MRRQIRPGEILTPGHVPCTEQMHAEDCRRHQAATETTLPTLCGLDTVERRQVTRSDRPRLTCHECACVADAHTERRKRQATPPTAADVRRWKRNRKRVVAVRPCYGIGCYTIGAITNEVKSRPGAWLWQLISVGGSEWLPIETIIQECPHGCEPLEILG